MPEPSVCPKCGASIPVDPRFTSWCECGWNLEAPPAPAARGSLGILQSLSRARGRAVFDACLRDSASRPRRTLTGLVLVLLSLVVLLGTLLPAAGAALLLWHGHGKPVWVVFAIVLIGITVALRPRFRRLPRRLLVSADTHPVLHGLVEKVARELRVAPPEHVGISADLNAYVTRVGVRQRQLLVLGLPLLSILDPQERVALVGHEVAHLANGDLTRGFVVEVAMQTLGTWEDLLAQPAPMNPSAGALLAWVVMLVLAQVPRGLFWVLARLAYDHSQRAEYFADRLGAEVGGTKAFVRMLQRMHHQDMLRLAQQRIVTRASTGTVLGEFASLVTSLPARELERIRRTASQGLSALDGTHPPTAFRVRLLEERPPAEPGVVLGRSEAEGLDRELARSAERINVELADAYRARLYRGSR